MPVNKQPTIVFITNICPHYRVKTFEILARHAATKFFFFSAGREWYWQQQHGTRKGNFDFEYLPGITVGRSRLTPSLLWKLLRADYDVVVKCINGKFALPVAYAIARARRKPFVLWTGIWQDLRTPLHRLIAPLTFYIYRHADAVVTYGDHVKRYLAGKGVPSEKIFPAHHAVDNELYARPVPAQELRDLRERLGLRDDSRVILYLGRIEPYKGLELLLAAFESVANPNAVLLFAGEGSMKAELQRRAASSRSSAQIRFIPYVPSEETPVYYALAWTAVLASVTTKSTRETWGLTTNEAMNQGVPVIASNTVGAADGGLVEDGVTGLVVPEGSVAALAQALRRMLQEPGLRDRLGEAARARVAGWDNERMVLGFRRAIDYVLGRGPDAQHLPPDPLTQRTAQCRAGRGTE